MGSGHLHHPATWTASQYVGADFLRRGWYSALLGTVHTRWIRCPIPEDASCCAAVVEIDALQSLFAKATNLIAREGCSTPNERDKLDRPIPSKGTAPRINNIGRRHKIMPTPLALRAGFFICTENVKWESYFFAAFTFTISHAKRPPFRLRAAVDMVR